MSIDTVQAKIVDGAAIPVVDFEPFHDGDPSGKRRVAAEIGAACEEIGFFYLRGHGIPSAQLGATFAADCLGAKRVARKVAPDAGRSGAWASERTSASNSNTGGRDRPLGRAR